MTKLFNTALKYSSTSWFIPIILMLGVFSITRLITTDSFPPIEKLRNWLFNHFPPDGHITDKRPVRGQFVMASNGIYHVNIGTWFGELVSCMWCAGWWVSLVVAGFFIYWPAATTMILFPFALRVVPGMISKVLGN